MRKILIAMMAAATLGLIGTSGASAAPIGGAALLDGARTANVLEQAQYYYYRRRHRHYRPHCRSYRVCDGYGYCWWRTRCR